MHESPLSAKANWLWNKRKLCPTTKGFKWRLTLHSSDHGMGSWGRTAFPPESRLGRTLTGVRGDLSLPASCFNVYLTKLSLSPFEALLKPVNHDFCTFTFRDTVLLYVHWWSQFSSSQEDISASSTDVAVLFFPQSHPNCPCPSSLWHPLAPHISSP